MIYSKQKDTIVYYKRKPQSHDWGMKVRLSREVVLN